MILSTIITMIRTIIGTAIIYNSIILFNEGYINEGLILSINKLTSTSPELVTLIMFIIIGMKIMR